MSRGRAPEVLRRTGRGGLGGEQAYWIPYSLLLSKNDRWHYLLKKLDTGFSLYVLIIEQKMSIFIDFLSFSVVYFGSYLTARTLFWSI